MHGSSNNDARQFFQKILSEGFKTGASFCKDQDGNLLTDIKPYITAMTHSANEMIRPSRRNTLDNAIPDRAEVAFAIQRLKSNKAVMMASLLNFLKQEEMSWLAICTTFSVIYGHWKWHAD